MARGHRVLAELGFRFRCAGALSAEPYVCPRLLSGLGRGKVDVCSGRRGTSPAPRSSLLPASCKAQLGCCLRLLSVCLLPSRPGESYSPTKANPQLPHSICFSPITHPTLPWGGEKRSSEEQPHLGTGTTAVPFPSLLTLDPLQLPSPVHRKLC